MKNILLITALIALAAGALGVAAFVLVGCSNGKSGSETVTTTPKTEAPDASEDNGAVLTFDSFDGGGPEYSVEIDDPELLTYTSTRRYYNPKHNEMCGSAYDVIFKFKGLKPGKTKLTIMARSPIAGNFDYTYEATVDEELSLRLDTNT